MVEELGLEPVEEWEQVLALVLVLELVGESVPAPALAQVQVWVGESSAPVVALATAAGDRARDWVPAQESLAEAGDSDWD